MKLRKIKKHQRKPRTKRLRIKNKMRMLYKSNSRRISKESARKIPENTKKAKIRTISSLKVPKNKQT
jgi:adenylate kinase